MPPRSSEESITLDKVGISVTDMTPELADDLGYKKSTKGVVITEVQQGSVAFEAGLRKGMLITKVDNQKVTSAQNAQQALQSASLSRGVLLQIQSPQGGTNFVLLRSEAQ